jgi:V8-like Glu-specific endopeptidase
MRGFSYVLTAIVLFTSEQALAYKFPLINKSSAQSLSLSDTSKDYDFEGIAKLSNCSGALVRFAGQPGSSKAMVLTNGHCNERGFSAPNTASNNVPSSRKFGLYTKEKSLVSVSATKIMFSTMTKTDITLYELKQTFDELEAQDVSAFTVDTQYPQVGLNIDIVSGYWNKGYNCSILASIYMLKEDKWTFTNSMSYKCNTIHGTSGSPIVEAGTRNVVGINNTGNDNGEKCTMDNPCEVSKDGTIKVIKDMSYGQQTADLYTCLTPDFQINLKQANCAYNFSVKR